jgi:hypothetical protein
MSRKFKSLLNLTTLPTDPNGSVGDVFFNTTEKAFKIHNGITWVTLVKNDDPTPFYMHTHAYDGSVHTVDVRNPITFKQINNQESVIENIPVTIGFDGGGPNSELSNPSFQDLSLLNGGLPESIYDIEPDDIINGGDSIIENLSIINGGDSDTEYTSTINGGNSIGD